jgi:hypothetical protein
MATKPLLDEPVDLLDLLIEGHHPLGEPGHQVGGQALPGQAVGRPSSPVDLSVWADPGSGHLARTEGATLMTTIANAHDTSAATSTQNPRTPGENHDGRAATAEPPRRRLLDRISEAVRAVHRASVPF